MTFDETVASITQTGLDWHRETILRNSLRNARHVVQTVRDIKPSARACLILSAGPSLYREGILGRIAASEKRPLLVATDGAYIQALKAGITPDYVITLDPHPTRMVRLFGAPAEGDADDYFDRTRPDQGFAEGTPSPAPLVISTTAPANVVQVTSDWPRWWFAPLVDAPVKGSLTRIMCAATKAPAMNTGGTVGTAAWTFAHSVLRSPNIAGVGWDFGYYAGTPLEQTQSWHMLGGDPAMYPTERGHWGDAFTDPTYAWYRDNFRDLLKAADARVTNCSGAGLLYGERVDCMELETWLASCS